MRARAMSTISDRDTSLWWLAAAPAIWAAHFLVSYVTAALWCAKLAGPSGSAGTAQLVIAMYTGGALGALLVVGLRGLRHHRHHRHGDVPPPHDDDSREGRHRFLGLATLLLAGLAAIAIVYEGLAVWLVGSCS